MAYAKSSQGIEPVRSGSTERIAVFLEVAEHDRQKLLWIARHITRDCSDAEDIVQDALLKAFKYLPQFRGDSQMGTWLCAIVKNAGRQWLRERKGKVFLSLENVRNPDDDPMVLDIVDPGRNPEQACAQRELSNLLLTEVNALNATCKSTIKICALDERLHGEAAKELGVSIASVKSRMFRGKRMLKQAICRRTGGADTFVQSVLATRYGGL
jgi:RNA polymerase sigma-70 factor (ECF subfamily)